MTSGRKRDERRVVACSAQRLIQRFALVEWDQQVNFSMQNQDWRIRLGDIPNRVGALYRLRAGLDRTADQTRFRRAFPVVAKLSIRARRIRAVTDHVFVHTEEVGWWIEGDCGAHGA